jgi:hypothetical protein
MALIVAATILPPDFHQRVIPYFVFEHFCSPLVHAMMEKRSKVEPVREGTRPNLTRDALSVGASFVSWPLRIRLAGL